MRYLFVLLCVCALGVVPVVGCAETAGEPCLHDCPCQRPLDEYRKDPTWEEAIAAAKEFVQKVRDCYEGFGYDSTAGRCGDFRYVHTNDNLADSYTEYFDAAGTLIFARWCSDGGVDVCPGAWCASYGSIPECEREQEQNLCVDKLCRDWCANEPNGVEIPAKWPASARIQSSAKANPPASLCRANPSVVKTNALSGLPPRRHNELVPRNSVLNMVPMR
jgi:hypothetical protein